MSESTAPHPIYNPDEYTRSDEPAPAPHTQPTQPPSQCPAGELPARWIVGLYGCNTGSASNVTVDIEGLRVMVSVVRHTADMQQISAVYLQLRTVVHRYTHVRAGISVIAPDLPPQVASARWRTPAGEVTLIRPRPGVRSRPRRLRHRLLGMPPLVAVAVWAHKASTTLRGGGGVAATAAGVATIAGVTAMTPAQPAPSTPPEPHPARTRQADLLNVSPVFKPSPSSQPKATTQPAGSPSANPQPQATPTATTPVGTAPVGTTQPDPAATPTPSPSAAPAATVKPAKAHTPHAGKTKKVKKPSSKQPKAKKAKAKRQRRKRAR